MNFDQCTEFGNEDEQYGQGTITAGPHSHYSDRNGRRSWKPRARHVFLRRTTRLALSVATRSQFEVGQAERSRM